MAKTEARASENYLSVLADGKFHQSVPEGTEGAVLRKYETSDGAPGEKWEKLFSDISGKITKVAFHDGNFGKSLLLTIDGGEDELDVVSLGCASNYGEDMMKKLLNLDLTKEVKLAPYSFKDPQTGKAKKGMTVWQDGVKVESYFHDYNADTKKVTVKNGYPAVPVPKKGKQIDSDGWKLYFATARAFMVDAITEHFKLDEVAEKDW